MAWSNRGHNSTAEIRAILQRDGYACVKCGNEQGPFDVDHIVPLAEGGTDEPSNKQTLCKPCHDKKTRPEIRRGRQRYYARRRLPQKPHPGFIR